MQVKQLANSRLLRYLAVALAVAAGLLGSYLLLRDSGLVAVDEVVITGVAGPQSKQIEDRLRGVATDMTTLNYSKDELLAAVSDFPQVANISVETKLLHRMNITVTQRRVLALIVSNGVETPVGFDGTLLSSGSKVPEELPTVETDEIPKNGKVTDSEALSALKVIDTGPREFIKRMRKVFKGKRGFTVEFRSGQKIYFGDANDLKKKWDAAVAVLADQEAKGASYVDVQVPDRPAVGGLAATTTTTTEPAPIPDSGQIAPSTTAPVVPESTVPAQPVVPTETVPVQ